MVNVTVFYVGVRQGPRGSYAYLTTIHEQVMRMDMASARRIISEKQAIRVKEAGKLDTTETYIPWHQVIKIELEPCDG